MKRCENLCATYNISCSLKKKDISCSVRLIYKYGVHFSHFHIEIMFFSFIFLENIVGVGVLSKLLHIKG